MAGPLQYHDGQVRVQQGANSRHVAEKLAQWVGPVERYAPAADLVLLSLRDPAGALRFAALSGPPPLVEPQAAGRFRLHRQLGAVLSLDGVTPVGGLVISLARAERARINGVIHPTGGDGLELEATELFTLCRKYMTPTAAVGDEPIAGPTARETVGLEDAWVTGLVRVAETTFLASISPEGAPDVAHRGGPPGFLTWDAAGRVLSWPEWVGDGVFKSAGNIRATEDATLLVPDFSSGEALELVGSASYETVLFDRRPRTDPLLRSRDPFPVQGRMTLRVAAAHRLRRFAWPRQATAGPAITSRSTIDEQAPV